MAMAMMSQYSETAPHQARASQSHPHPNPHFEIQDDEADGETLAARFQMLEELGSGSFGVVYKAIEKATGEIVAIKHVRTRHSLILLWVHRTALQASRWAFDSRAPANFLFQVDLESSEEDLSDILSELAVLSSCSSPYVTKYRLAFLRRQTLWIVMEYLGGGSCADLLKPPPHSLSESHIAIICRELLLGLAYLHREGKLHRDIKAANVLLGMDGRVKLADFGVAAQLVGLKSVRNTFVGTPFWMAPEVIQQEGHDAKADIWSLGITAMELANGEPPHANVHPMKVLFLIPKQPAPRLEGSKWSKDFRDFVASCLTKDVDKRSSAKDLLEHRFIRSAGKVEGLQELIVRKQDWEASKGGDRHLKYYAETLRSLSANQNDDDWVFETIKAVPTIAAVQTQKRRKVDRRSSVDVRGDDESNTKTTNGQDLDPNSAKLTMRKIPKQTERRDTTDSQSMGRRTVRKRISSAQARQPLGVNMSFGNSPSTVRQFRRVSPSSNVTNGESTSDPARENEHENKDPDTTGSVVRTPSKAGKLGPLSFVGQNIVLNPESKSERRDGDDGSSRLSGKESRLGTDNSRLSDESLTSSRFTQDTRPSSIASTVPLTEPKEATLGRRLYSTAIGISCQDVLNETADETKREAVARLAEAFSDLESVDPDGVYHVMAAIVAKMKQDSTLREALLLPQLEDQQVGHTSLSASASTMQSSQNAGDLQSVTQPDTNLRLLPQLQSQSQPAAPTSTSTSIPASTSTSATDSASAPFSQPTSANASRQVTPSTSTATSTSSPRTPNSPMSGGLQQINGAKLVLAQNNPHLKSHRRRQSAQASVGSVKSRESSRAFTNSNNNGLANGGGSPLKKGINSPANVGSPRGTGRMRPNVKVAGAGSDLFDDGDGIGENKDVDMMTMMDGLVGGLDHTRQLADVLFERWCEGLRVRWPAV